MTRKKNKHERFIQLLASVHRNLKKIEKGQIIVTAKYRVK